MYPSYASPSFCHLSLSVPLPAACFPVVLLLYCFLADFKEMESTNTTYQRLREIDLLYWDFLLIHVKKGRRKLPVVYLNCFTIIILFLIYFVHNSVFWSGKVQKFWSGKTGIFSKKITMYQLPTLNCQHLSSVEWIMQFLNKMLYIEKRSPILVQSKGALLLSQPTRRRLVLNCPNLNDEDF